MGKNIDNLQKIYKNILNNVKRCCSLTIREIQIKTILRYCSHPSDWLKFESLTIYSVQEVINSHSYRLLLELQNGPQQMEEMLAIAKQKYICNYTLTEQSHFQELAGRYTFYTANIHIRKVLHCTIICNCKNIGIYLNS